MKTTLLKISFLSLICFNSYGANHLVYIGGGGEPKGSSTIFDDHISSIRSLTSKNTWSYDVAFNGGHNKTEALVKSAFPSPTTPALNFTKNDYDRIIAEAKSKITTGTLKKDDQLVLVIDTHGAEKSSGEVTHKISLSGGGNVTNLNTLAGGRLQNLDGLKELITLSEKQGVKLAIVDLSCHSGNTLELAKNSKKTCIISSSGPNHYGYTGRGSFTDRFIDKLSTDGISLEDAFLQARLSSNDSAYPLINTINSDKAFKEFYDLIGPYLNSQYTEGLGKLHTQILEMNDAINKCSRQSQFEDLISKLQGMKNLSDKAFSARDGLVNHLKEYYSLQMQMLQASQAYGTDKMERTENFKSEEINPKTNKPYFNVNFTWEQLSQIHIETFKASTEKNLKPYLNDPDFQQRRKATDKLLENLFKRVQFIHTNHPQLRDSVQNSLKYTYNIKNTFNLSEKIGQKEKLIYDSIYNSVSRNPNNPCQQIKM